MADLVSCFQNDAFQREAYQQYGAYGGGLPGTHYSTIPSDPSRWVSPEINPLWMARSPRTLRSHREDEGFPKRLDYGDPEDNRTRSLT